MTLNQETFLSLSIEEIVEIVKSENRPRLGIFVPDGSRRLVLAFTEAEPGTEEFYRLSATLPAQYLLESLKVFFDHGLPTLMVPILSRSVINRGSGYRLWTVLEGLKLLFHSKEWADFYDKYDICVNVYGEPERLENTESKDALAWIKETIHRTSNNQSHRLFYAIGEAPVLGEDIAQLGIDFYREHGQTPTLKEQILHYYGEDLPLADFFIMNSKISGLGALPRFLSNGDTAAYFLPAAGSIGLNNHTYRLILYDLLFERNGLQAEYTQSNSSPTQRKALKAFYQKSQHKVIGLGHRISNSWVPE